MTTTSSEIIGRFIATVDTHHAVKIAVLKDGKTTDDKFARAPTPDELSALCAKYRGQTIQILVRTKKEPHSKWLYVGARKFTIEGAS